MSLLVQIDGQQIDNVKNIRDGKRELDFYQETLTSRMLRTPDQLSRYLHNVAYSPLDRFLALLRKHVLPKSSSHERAYHDALSQLMVCAGRLTLACALFAWHQTLAQQSAAFVARHILAGQQIAAGRFLDAGDQSLSLPHFAEDSRPSRSTVSQEGRQRERSCIGADQMPIYQCR